MINLFEGWTNGLYKTDEQLKKNRNDPKYEFQYRYPGDKDKDRRKLQKILMEYEPYINAKNFIGWPTTYNLGGYCIEDKTIRKTRKELTELWNISLTSKKKERELKLKSTKKLKNHKILNHQANILTHNKKRSLKTFNKLEKMKKKALKHLNKNQSFHKFHDMSI